LKKVNDLLDREESDVMWYRWWSYWHYWNKAWSLYWNLARVPEIGASAYALRQTAFEYARLMGHNYPKKLSWMFGDVLNYRIETNQVGDDWEQCVSESFVYGYRYANSYAKTKALTIFKEAVKGFFRESLIGKIEIVILDQVKDLLEDTDKLIPEPLKKLLDVKNVVSETISHILDPALEEIFTKGAFEPFSADFTNMKFGDSCIPEATDVGFVIDRTPKLKKTKSKKNQEQKTGKDTKKREKKDKPKGKKENERKEMKKVKTKKHSKPKLKHRSKKK